MKLIFLSFNENGDLIYIRIIHFGYVIVIVYIPYVYIFTNIISLNIGVTFTIRNIMNTPSFLYERRILRRIRSPHLSKNKKKGGFSFVDYLSSRSKTCTLIN